MPPPPICPPDGSASPAPTPAVVEERLQALRQKLGRKQHFEEAIADLAATLRDRYAGASPALRKSHRSSSESSSSSSSESSSSDDEGRGSRKSRSRSRSKRNKKDNKNRSRYNHTSSDSEEEGGPVRLSKFFGNKKN